MTLPFRTLALPAIAALGLAACDSDVTPETQLPADDEAEMVVSDPVPRETPVSPDLNGAKSAETEQPTLGVDSVEGDLGSGAEPPSN